MKSIKHIKIRPERKEDYHQIAELEYLAFQEKYAGESTLVNMLRQNRYFDPEMALVAVDGSTVVGHVIFHPRTLYSKNVEIKAVNLAPLAVLPGYQKKGIGTKLIVKGHEIAKKKGYACSFLWGHPSYYPRHGYMQKMFSWAGISIRSKDIPFRKINFDEKIILPSNLNYIIRLWKKWFEDASLSLFSGSSILDWISYSKIIRAVVLFRGKRRLGCVRYNINSPESPMLFLPEDDKAFKDMLIYLKAKTRKNIFLPIYPDSQMLRRCIKLPFKEKGEACDAFMIKILDEKNKIIKNYFERVKNKTIKPGLLILQSLYDIV